MPDSLIVESRDGFGIASVMARKGVYASAIGAALCVNIPDRACATQAPARTIVGTGPGTWLILEAQASPDFAETLQNDLNGIASVADQSSGYAVWRLSGAGARSLLQRGVPLDFHPSAFVTGSAATTVIAHIGVILWQVDEQPSYDVLTFRSYARSFNHWLQQTAATL